MSFLFVILGLIAIIMVHEAGHFLAARAVGIRVTRFFLFFPPTLFSWKRGDVEYGIGWIPLGGFVRMPGMFEPSGEDAWIEMEPLVDDVVAGVAAPSLRERIRTAGADLAGAANAGFVDRAARELVECVREAMELRPAGSPDVDGDLTDAVWQRRVRQLRSRCESLIDDVHEEAYWRASLWRRMVVIAAGPAVNVLLAFVVLWGVFMLHDPVERYEWRVGSVVAASPAATAGIRKGDRIVEWNGVRPGTSERGVERFAKVIEHGHGKPIVIVVRRDGTERRVRLVPTHVVVDGTRSKDLRVGIMTMVEPRVDHYRRTGPIKAARSAGRVTWYNARLAVTGITDRFRQRNLDDLHTVVGVVQIAPQVEREGVLIHFLAVLSLAIAIYNLLPILPLDGGHLAFGLIELVRRGRPVSRHAFARASAAGMMFLLLVFIAGLRNDFSS